MNILFITLSTFNNIQEAGIYHDLMRKFILEGHKVHIITPIERRTGKRTQIHTEPGSKILKVKTLNIQKATILEKGIGVLLLDFQYIRALKRFFKGIKFDLILYSTPPVTITRIIKYIKRRDQARTYLLLKDIFPQNAVDLNLIKRESLLHKYFRYKESILYSISDSIGCMSPANVKYICSHNPKLDPNKIHHNPNSIEIRELQKLTNFDKLSIKKNYNLPENSTIFIYGGNIGKPQGVDFLLKVLETFRNSHECYFIIVGSGTEYKKVSDWFSAKEPINAQLIPFLPKDKFDQLLSISDVGLIFLDSRFTIPNFPSRILSYMEYKMPVIAATDNSTDLGKIIESNGFGLWCNSGDISIMKRNIEILISDPKRRHCMGEMGLHYLLENYTIDKTYSIIMKSMVNANV